MCQVDESEDMLDRIGALVDASLVVVERSDGPTRYRFLEPVRQFALERLGALGPGEEQAIRARHLAWCLELCEERAPTRMGEAIEWRARIRRDSPNILAALDSCDHLPGGPRAALRILAAVANVWADSGWAELREKQIERALRRPGAEEPSRERMLCLGMATIGDWDSALAQQRIEEALDLAVRLGDRSGEGSVLSWLGQRAMARRALAEARVLYELSLIHI